MLKKDLYNQNMDILKKTNISQDMIEQLEKYELNKDIDNIESKDGLLTFRYEIEQEKKIYVHSLYNVNREIDNLLKNIDDTKDCIYFVYGLGMGHHIEALKSKISNNSYIYVVERNLDIVVNFLSNRELNSILGGNVLLFFGDEEILISEISRKTLYFNIMPLFVNTKTVMLHSYEKIYKSWIVDFNTNLMNIVRHSLFILGNDMNDTIIGIKNNFENIEELIKSSDLEPIKNKYENVPLIIVSAGPSLDKNIKDLKEAEGKSIIIATDATLSTLKKHKIKPDGVVSIERILATYEKFYKGKEIDEDIVLISPPVIREEIFKTMKNNKKLICLKKGEKINEWINNDILGDNRLLDMGTSCAHIAFSIGKYMGANPIIFIGQDLAFTKEGITHQSDAEVIEKIELDKREDIVYVEGIDGTMLPTYKSFKNFLTWFEIKIAEDRTSRKYIDATEGGALINGTTIMTLKDVVEKYCTTRIIPLRDNLRINSNSNTIISTAIKEVSDLESVFNLIRREAGAHILKLEKFDKMISNQEYIKDKTLFKAVDLLNRMGKIENMIYKNDVARTLFQAPVMMSLTRLRKIGNKLNVDNVKETVTVHKRMAASIITGCYAVQIELKSVLKKLESIR